MDIKPTIQIGKRGITETLLSEIKSQLKKREFIKVKVLKSAKKDAKCKDIADEIAKLTNSKIVDIRGNTFILSGDGVKNKEQG